MKEPKDRIALLLTSIVTLTSIGCGRSSSVVEARAAKAVDIASPKEVENLTQLYVNDRAMRYENAIVQVDGMEFEFDHRCTMFGWYEFSCVFRSHMPDELIAKAIQHAWNTQRIDGMPAVEFEKEALDCLHRSYARNGPEATKLPCDRFNLTVNAFRAIDDSRHEIWLRFERKRDELVGSDEQPK